MSHTIEALIGAVVVGAIGAFFVIRKFFSKPPVLLKDPNEKHNVKLIEKHIVSHDTRRFRFALPGPEYELGLPLGQHIYLNATIDEKLVIRPYTPVSTEHVKGHFDLVIKVYFKNVHPKFPEGGKMSQYLESLNIGDSISIRGPNGLINYKGKGMFAIKKNKQSPPEMRHYKRVGMIAGGTGITPMLQILQSALDNISDQTEFSLIFANQTEQDILVRDLLEDLAKYHESRFHLWYTIDKSDENWKYSTGFINAEMISSHMPPPDEDTAILMCGPPPMIQFACNPNLDKLGYPVQHRFTF